MKEIVKIIGKYLNKYRDQVYKIWFLYVIIAALQIINPYIFGNLVNTILKNSAENKNVGEIPVFQYILIISLVIVIIILKRYLDFRRTRIAGYCERDMALAINKQILILPRYYHDNKKNGEILEVIAVARWNINTIINQIAFSALPEIIIVILIVIVSLFINYILTIIIFSLVMVLTLASQIKSGELIEIETNYMGSRKAAANYADDTIRNIDTIKTFAIEDRIQENYEQKYKSIQNSFEMGLELAVNVNAIQLLIILLGSPIIFIVSSRLLAQGSITAGSCVTIIVYAGLILKPFQTLSENYAMLKKGMVSIKEADKFLTKEKAEEMDVGKIPNEPIKGGVELKNIAFAYGNSEKVIFSGLNLKILAGEKVAIRAPNGSGKSTLIKLLMRNYDPTEGEILIDGINIKDLPLSFLRRCFAVVPQKIDLFNDSIINNLRIVNPEVSDEDLLRAAKAAKMDFVCEYIDGFNHIINEQEKNISPGQAQRIAIARIIPNKAPFVILDEPTSAQDMVSEDELAKLLEGQFKNKTVIMISHRDKPLKYVDRVLEIKDGKIIEIAK